MKNLLRFTLGFCLLTSTVLSASAAFSSLYVFGDALSATADATYSPGPPYYYQQRWSNGRVWVEVLAQRQGLQFDDTKNNSYYDHNSAVLAANINNFTVPPDVANDLFIVWVCNADTFDAASAHFNSNQWNNAINQSQANHLQIITNLYAMGVRTLILPNAVDISEIPAYNRAASTNAMHNGCVAYNAAFSNTINQAMALCPELTIYAPDFFTLLNSVLTNATYYGLTNALSAGFSIDALDDPSIFNTVSMNGPGTNYIFWDKKDPTAQFHEVIADVVQQLISPVQINGLALFKGSNRLDIVNMPLGLDGFVEGSTNLTQSSWTSVTNLSSTSVNQSFFVNALPLPPSIPPSGSGGSTDPNNPTNSGTYFPGFNPGQYYRLHFPYAWSWP